jgi:hypothetical protein
VYLGFNARKNSLKYRFKYDIDGYWYIYDGDGEQSSRNGLW